jgi:hypothetical protein
MIEVAGSILIAVGVLAVAAIVLAVAYPLLWMGFHGILMLLGIEKEDDIIC